MSENLFCYVREIDIDKDLKASEENSDCIGCRYFSFCKRDLEIINNNTNNNEDKKQETKVEVKEKIIKEVVTVEENKGVVSKSKGKNKTKKKVKKKTKEEKIMELASEDIF